MIILQGAIHIFTEQPNSVAKSIYNGLRRQMTHLLEYETIKTSTIIQYPHAVSYFCELNLSSVFLIDVSISALLNLKLAVEYRSSES